MAKLTKLDHGSLCVGDIDKAVGFYGDLLGLEPLPRPDFGFPGAWFNAGGTPVHLTTGGYLRDDDAELRPNDGHLAFLVDDLEELTEELTEAGVEWWELPQLAGSRSAGLLQRPMGQHARGNPLLAPPAPRRTPGRPVPPRGQ